MQAARKQEVNVGMWNLIFGGSVSAALRREVASGSHWEQFSLIKPNDHSGLPVFPVWPVCFRLQSQSMENTVAGSVERVLKHGESLLR